MQAVLKSITVVLNCVQSLLNPTLVTHNSILPVLNSTLSLHNAMHVVLNRCQAPYNATLASCNTMQVFCKFLLGKKNFCPYTTDNFNILVFPSSVRGMLAMLTMRSFFFSSFSFRRRSLMSMMVWSVLMNLS